ncbi:Glycoside hydrolase, partial [Globisporangium splendens]
MATDNSPSNTTTHELPNTRWTTCGRKLLKDNKSFFVRGVNYAPTPIGRPGRLDLLNDTRIFTRDLKNLRDMHANAVKTYDFYADVDHTAYLDAAYNNGDEPIYTIFSIWIDQALMDPSVLESSPAFQDMVLQYLRMAQTTGGHPGVMGYSIGGEMNSITVIHERSFWEKFAALTGAVRRGLTENDSAQKIITTTFIDDGGQSFRTGASFNADVDLWGSNVYQSNYEGSVIPKYMGIPGDKPLLVSEYGFPYASEKQEGTEQELLVVGHALLNQTLAMHANFNRSDALKEQILVGGFVFEYSDEWWKSGAEDIHNLGTVRNKGFPLGYLSEEYFGLFGAVRNEEEFGVDGVDLLHARPTVALLTDLWAKRDLVDEGVDYTYCNRTLNEILMKHDEEVVTVHHWSWFSELMAVLAVCVVALIGYTVYRTRMRRARYERISSSKAMMSPVQ